MCETAGKESVVSRMYRLMLAPTKTPAEHLNRWAGTARFAHNHALAERQQRWNPSGGHSLPELSAGAAAIVCDGRPDRRTVIS